MTGPRPAGDPCADLRAEAARLCDEALRLAEVAGERAAELRRERHTGAQLDRREAAARLGDPGATSRAKEDAVRRFRDTRRRPGVAGTQAAAAELLRELDRLNRAARAAGGRSPDAAERRWATETTLERLDVAAEAARIAAEEAAEACQRARMRLAQCQESQAGPGLMVPRVMEADSAVVRLVRGDQRAVERLADRAAAASGLAVTEARRLLGLLTAALADAALDAGSLSFPSDHFFWRQLPADDARRVAMAMGELGNGFDGRGGWRRGWPADHRLLAEALAVAGYDIRGLDFPRTSSEMGGLWAGTAVDVPGFLARGAPDLSLERVSSLVAARASALGPLWDRWGYIRPLLLAADRG